MIPGACAVQVANLERASSQGLQRLSAAGGPPARSRSGGRGLPRISGSAHGGTSGGSGGLPRVSGDAPDRALSGGRGDVADPATVSTGVAVPAAGAAAASAGGRFGQPRQQDDAAVRPAASQMTAVPPVAAGHGPQGSGSATGFGSSAGAAASGSTMLDGLVQPTAPIEQPAPPQHPSRPGSPPPSPQRSAGGASLPDSGAGSPVTARKSQSGELRQKFGLAGDESSGRSSPGP